MLLDDKLKTQLAVEFYSVNSKRSTSIALPLTAATLRLLSGGGAHAVVRLRPREWPADYQETGLGKLRAPY